MSMIVGHRGLWRNSITEMTYVAEARITSGPAATRAASGPGQGVTARRGRIRVWRSSTSVDPFYVRISGLPGVGRDGLACTIEGQRRPSIQTETSRQMYRPYPSSSLDKAIVRQQAAQPPAHMHTPDSESVFQASAQSLHSLITRHRPRLRCCPPHRSLLR